MKVIDLFAGAGGFSTGAVAAGCEVVWAGNHWPVATEAHARNHPSAVHACQDLQQQDWGMVPTHDVTLASPACQGHSRARGKDRVHHDAARSTAWAVVSCAEVHRAPVVIVENVPEFLRWALFPAWQMAMERLGYALSINLIDAADHGVPQNRRRVFIVLTRSRSAMVLRLPRREERSARTILDLTDRGSSKVADKCLRTRERVANGRKRFGRQFLVAYYGNEQGGRSLDRPLGTVTTVDRYALVTDDRMRMLKLSESKAAMGFSPDYWLPPNQRLALHLLGNAVCPDVARDILREVRKAA